MALAGRRFDEGEPRQLKWGGAQPGGKYKAARELNKMGAKVTYGIRTLELGLGVTPVQRAQSWSHANDNLNSVVFCYTSHDPKIVKAAVDAINAMPDIDGSRDFVVSDPDFLSTIQEAIVREHTADRKRTVFQVRLTNTSMLSVGRLSAMVRALRRSIPEVLVLWENQLRL